MLACQYSVLREKAGPILPPLVDLMAGRQAGSRLAAGRQVGKTGRQVGRQVGGWAAGWAGRQADKIRLSFKIFKILEFKLLGLLFCVILLHYYYRSRTSFQ